jgi:hypothetical protein
MTETASVKLKVLEEFRRASSSARRVPVDIAATLQPNGL